MFPHYTWVYIEATKTKKGQHCVPSLYVRVYRVPQRFVCCSYCSLTIREGISYLLKFALLCSWFPHYTWGYIGLQVVSASSVIVPSLYVRVYRHIPYRFCLRRCSLTIREGISAWYRRFISISAFPHYTWGYITRLIRCKPVWRVPSLYVRVYHLSFSSFVFPWSSLTIREGISLGRKHCTGLAWFPHYTWGYIEKKCKKRRKNCVPSLYVRVYWSFSLLPESRMLKM